MAQRHIILHWNQDEVPIIPGPLLSEDEDESFGPETNEVSMENLTRTRKMLSPVSDPNGLTIDFDKGFLSNKDKNGWTDYSVSIKELDFSHNDESPMYLRCCDA